MISATTTTTITTKDFVIKNYGYNNGYRVSVTPNRAGTLYYGDSSRNMSANEEFFVLNRYTFSGSKYVLNGYFV